MITGEIMSELQNFFLGRPEIAGLVGSRLFPGQARAGIPFPFVTFIQTGSEPQFHTTGESGLIQADFQFDIWSDESVQARQLARQFRLAASGYLRKKPLVSNEPSVDWMQVSSQRETMIPPGDGSEVAIYNVSLDIDLWYRDTVPEHAVS